MNKVAVFGKPGGGKSTLSRQLSEATGIPYCPIDSIEYKQNGVRVSAEAFSQKHDELIISDRWIIDGLGTLESFWARLDMADTLIYVDLPYIVHYWWVTKRLLKSFYTKPIGWPDGSSVLKGTLAGWKYLRLSPKFWTPELYQQIHSRNDGKTLYHIRSVNEINHFVKQLS